MTLKKVVKNIPMQRLLQKNPFYTGNLFEQYYPGQVEMIPGFWMPNKKWEGCDVADPSARVLSNYGDSGK